jgi:hypothetical protein
MKPKRYSAGLALQDLKAAVQFSGMTRLGLVLVANGWRRPGHAALGKTGAELEIDSLPLKLQTTGAKA